MSQRSILVVDDEVGIQDSLRGALSDEGYRVFTASSAQEGFELLKKNEIDVVLLDIWMPEMDGLTALKQIKTSRGDQMVIMMSGHGNIESAVKATKAGAFDFVEKPLSLEKLLVLIRNAIGNSDLARENTALREQFNKSVNLVGETAAIRSITEVIKRVAPTTGSVLITGENGTGKELVAQMIHLYSNRFNHPFIEVNCAAIPDELIESELFGHEKGAFTGATQLRRGKFDLAHGGTIFLDEIGDMSLKTQAKILRILQEQKFERVGGSQTLAVDVRVVAATNKDLKNEIKEGRFRDDLYYRLNVIPFHMPPLRDRIDDLDLLANYFLDQFSHVHGRQRRMLSPEALRILQSYVWPGNVRELKNFIERLVILSTDSSSGKIEAQEVLEQFGSEYSAAIPNFRQTGAASSNLKDARSEFERDFILKALNDNGWNVSKTAQVLGIERTHLHRKIKFLGLSHEALPKEEHVAKNQS